MSKGKNSWSFIKEFLKAYWWAILIVIIAPVLINYLILKPAFFNFVGKDTDWLGFWGAYIGTVLSSVIAFYVLHKQLEQNQNENKSNRDLQIGILKYQQKSQWLTELKVKLAEYYEAYSFNDVNAIGDNILVRSIRLSEQIKDARTSLKLIMDNFNIADFSKGILFPKDLDSRETELLGELKFYSDEFCSLLEDLDWYLFSVFGHNGGDSMLREMYIDKTNAYKQESHSHESKSRRIWEVIEEYDYKITSNNKKIIATRMKEARKNLKPEDIQKTITELIDYEQDIINKIIATNNATK